MKTKQTHIEAYILHYAHKSVHRYFRSVDECIEYIFSQYDQTGTEPQKITLPSGNTIKYNMYTMTRVYLANRRVNERQLINALQQATA